MFYKKHVKWNFKVNSLNFTRKHQPWSPFQNRTLQQMFFWTPLGDWFCFFNFNRNACNSYFRICSWTWLYKSKKSRFSCLGVIHLVHKQNFPGNAYLRVRIRGLEMLIFRKILCTYEMIIFKKTQIYFPQHLNSSRIENQRQKKQKNSVITCSFSCWQKSCS